MYPLTLKSSDRHFKHLSSLFLICSDPRETFEQKMNAMLPCDNQLPQIIQSCVRIISFEWVHENRSSHFKVRRPSHAWPVSFRSPTSYICDQLIIFYFFMRGPLFQATVGFS